jgi:CBS domain-containing protein
MKVREIMTSGSLATATLDTTLEEIANMMKAEDVGAIPVLDDDEKLAGIITDRDIVVRAIAEGEDPTECTAEDILSEQLHTIAPDADVQEAVQLMSQHQIRRLPVIKDEAVIGIISLGDLSVKSQRQQASEALEDISEGVRQQSGRDRGDGDQSNSAGDREEQGQSSGEQVAEEETDYQRGAQDTAIRRGTAQMSSSRAESRQAGRVRNQSKSRQTIENEQVDVEGEEEPRFQNAGGGQARQRANKQNATSRPKQNSSRGRQDSSARGRDAGQVRGEDGGRKSRGNTQGITNRSSRQENQRQQKVAPMRAESKTGRSQGKRRAS